MKTFPILWPSRKEQKRLFEVYGCPRELPWGIVAPHEKQAQLNHGQSLERLAERGALDVLELAVVLTDRKLGVSLDMQSREAVDVIKEVLDQWNRT